MNTHTPFNPIYAPWLESFDTIFPIGIPPLPPEDGRVVPQQQLHLEWDDDSSTFI